MYGLILALCLFTRFPYFFPSVIDWDESTFILIGQDLLEGNLPYVNLWDVKAPLAYGFFAVVIALFGKSIVAIRVAGMLCVFITAVATYHIGEELWNWVAGLAAAVLTVVFIAVTPDGQAVMTEIICIAPAMVALWLLVGGTWNVKRLYAVGILLAFAILVRQNLAYLVVFLGVLVLVGLSPNGERCKIIHILAFALGVVTPVTAVLLPYLATGHLGVFVQSVIRAPLVGTGLNYSVLESVSLLKKKGFGLHNWLLWGGALCSMPLLLWRGTLFVGERKKILLLTGSFLAVALSIAKSGYAWPHYLLQIVPFLSLAAGFLISTMLKTPLRLLILALVVIGLIIPLRPVVGQYRRLINRVEDGNSLYADAGYRIAEYLRKENSDGEPIYLLTDHIGYWLLNVKPVTKIAHPSNISREYLLHFAYGPHATAKTVMAEILDKKPRFIVIHKDKRKIMERVPKAKLLLDQTLQGHYVLVQEINRRLIYKRKPSIDR
jgi:4-amino-4-deoxy-L-arabinose transferase-like glycosyltransferase